MIKSGIARGKPAEYGQLIVKRRQRLTAACVNLEHKAILDFGCGNGAQSIEFKEYDSQITAIDIDAGDLSTFQDVINAEKIDNITVLQYDGRSLPFADQTFDLIVSFEVLEHVGDETVVLKELHRVMKDGSDLIMSVPNKGWIFETHGAYLPFLPWNRVPFFSWLPHFIHRRFAKARIYRRRDIVRLLKSHGFVVQSTNYITAPMDVIKNPVLKKFLRRTIFRNDSTPFSILSTAVLVHAKKSSGNIAI